MAVRGEFSLLVVLLVVLAGLTVPAVAVPDTASVGVVHYSGTLTLTEDLDEDHPADAATGSAEFHDVQTARASVHVDISASGGSAGTVTLTSPSFSETTTRTSSDSCNAFTDTYTLDTSKSATWSYGSPRPSGTVSFPALVSSNSTCHAHPTHATVSFACPTASTPTDSSFVYAYTNTANPGGGITGQATYTCTGTLRPAGTVQPVVNSTADRALKSGAVSCDTGQVVGTGPSAQAECTLRAAIQLVNDSDAAQITFAIPAASGLAADPVIAPTSALPKVTKPVTIDGTSQGSWVVLSGTSAAAGDGLEVDGAASTIRGLVVNGFTAGAGIVAGATGTRIVGNRIGTDATGTTAVPNMYGVVFHALGVTIGGDSATSWSACTGDCNQVAGNTAFQIGNADLDEPAFAASTIKGNWVGVDATGEKAITEPANSDGVRVLWGKTTSFAAGEVLTIGGVSSRPGAAPGNLVVAPGRAIVAASTYAGPDNALAGSAVIAGNLIGEDAAGTAALGSGRYGIRADASRLPPGAMVIGGDTGAGNVVGGEQTAAVDTEGGSAVTVVGNRVGTDLSGESAVANGVGVSTSGGTQLRDNLVSGNTLGIDADGVVLTRGNIVGLDARGTKALPNDVGIGSDSGIQTAAIGVDPTSSTPVCSADPCNVISGNTTAGIRLNGSGVDTLWLAGTYVGTDITGNKAVPNGVGIQVTSPNLYQQRIGGASSAAAGRGCRYPCNVVAGNTGAGIQLAWAASPADDDRSADHTVVSGNYLGVDAAGQALPNHGPGLQIDTGGTPPSTIGVGGDARRGNLIATSFAAGAPPAVSIGGDGSAYPRVTLLSNVYHVPGPASAIARPPASVGAPRLEAAGDDDGGVVVNGSTRVTADPLEAPEQIEIYAVSACGQAGTYVAVASGAANRLNGAFNIQVPPAALAGRTGLYALRTDQAGSTSTFSPCLTGPTVTTSNRALAATGREIEVASNTGWRPGDYAQIHTASGNVVRRVAALGSLILAAPVGVRVPTGAVIEKVTAPHNDRKPPNVKAHKIPARIRKGPAVTVRITCSDLGGVGVAHCPKHVHLPAKVRGQHRVEVLAWDRNGNLAQLVIRYTVVP